MTDAKCQVLLAGDPSSPSLYAPGRAFLLRSTMIATDLPLTGFHARKARLFVGTKNTLTHLITLAHPFDPTPPSGNPYPHLGVGEEEIDLLEIDVVALALTFKKKGSFRMSTRVPLRTTAIFEERVPWIFPLLIPRRLPASLRTMSKGSFSCLSQWTRLS
jgi:hypothetical protein